MDAKTLDQSYDPLTLLKQIANDFNLNLVVTQLNEHPVRVVIIKPDLDLSCEKLPSHRGTEEF